MYHQLFIAMCYIFAVAWFLVFWQGNRQGLLEKHGLTTSLFASAFLAGLISAALYCALAALVLVFSIGKGCH